MILKNKHITHIHYIDHACESLCLLNHFISTQPQFINKHHSHILTLQNYYIAFLNIQISKIIKLFSHQEHSLNLEIFHKKTTKYSAKEHAHLIKILDALTKEIKHPNFIQLLHHKKDIITFDISIITLSSPQDDFQMIYSKILEIEEHLSHKI